MGLESIFKDFKTGVYNLEGSQASIQCFTNSILLIAISYISSYYRGQIIKKNGYQNYICRFTELRRKERINNHFWVIIYGNLWTIAGYYLFEIVENIINLNPQKKPNYRKRLIAISKL